MFSLASRISLFAGLLTLALPQSGQESPNSRAASDHPLTSPQNSALEHLAADFTRREYALTAQEGLRMLRNGKFNGRPDLSLRASRIVGAAQLACGSYRDALQTLLPARKSASARHDLPALVSINNNIAWIYVKMENFAAATIYADQAVAALRAQKKFDARVIALRAFIYSREQDFTKSNALFSEAINGALDNDDVATAATEWSLEGRAFTLAHQTAQAESALTESFRLRKLHHLPDLEVSMRDLAEELAVRGDLKTSTVLLDEAIDRMGDPKSTADIWGFLLDRGRLRMMKGDLEGALPDLRGALAIARRLDVIPTDDDRITFESGLAELYTLFIDCGNRIYLKTHDDRLKAEVFEASEENRAASLRALVPQPHDWRSQLPPEYSQMLGQLQNAEREVLIAPSRTAELNVRKLRASLDLLEAGYQSSEPESQGSALEAARRAIDSNTALLAFHLGPTNSWVWAITEHAFDVFPLPAEPRLAKDFAQFRAGVRSGKDVQQIADSLGRTLLAHLPAEIHRKTKWTIVLDQDLFDLPFSALCWEGKYLIEDHSILITPGVRLLKRNTGEPISPTGRLIALGDPIYSHADPRWPAESHLPVFHVFAAEKPESFQFPRLIGSGQEARSAVANWGNGQVITGQDATKKNVLRIFEERSTIIHLATHVIRAAGDDRAGMIVLSLNPQGETEFLDMRDIARNPVHTRLVVMSGCASGDAKAQSATGLMGLTRAWLGSGVDEVLATRWPSLDDNGPFFSSFYRNLRNNPGRGASGALQNASLEMLHSDSFRKNPEYWASYFLIGTI